MTLTVEDMVKLKEQMEIHKISITQVMVLITYYSIFKELVGNDHALIQKIESFGGTNGKSED